MREAGFSQNHEEDRESSSCKVCDQMLRSYIGTCIPYLRNDPDKPNQRSIDLGRVSFAGFLVKKRSYEHHKQYPTVWGDTFLP